MPHAITAAVRDKVRALLAERLLAERPMKMSRMPEVALNGERERTASLSFAGCQASNSARRVVSNAFRTGGRTT